MLLRCPTCNEPLAARTPENQIQILTHRKGKFEVGIDINVHDNGDYRIRCENCKSSHIFAMFHDPMGINDEMEKSMTPVLSS
jgi:hypothetical protein